MVDCTKPYFNNQFFIDQVKLDCNFCVNLFRLDQSTSKLSCDDQGWVGSLMLVIYFLFNDLKCWQPFPTYFWALIYSLKQQQNSVKTKSNTWLLNRDVCYENLPTYPKCSRVTHNHHKKWPQNLGNLNLVESTKDSDICLFFYHS